VNIALQDACAANGYIFIDIGLHYSDEDGFLRKDRSDGCVHVGDTTWVRSTLSDMRLV
jgi:hypothetical protein